jgi:hypothetical protein
MLRYRSRRVVNTLTTPLRPKGVTMTPLGEVTHDSVIGKRVLEIVKTDRMVELYVDLPTLDEYVCMTPRLVTPVWS